jgi:iron complex outermembrane receptor protein
MIMAETAFAESFSLSGKVIDSDSKLSLPGATVRIEGTGVGAIADKDGNFKINKLIAGNYRIMVSVIGYKVYSDEIEIDKNLENITFSLTNKGFETSEIVISANKRIQTVQEVPISMSIIDYNSSKNRNYSRIDEILRIVPGVNLNKDNVNIRGSSGFAFGVGSRVLLLIDGFPMLSGDNGDMKFDAIPMLNVERIEVVKGAGSALYGSSALGGIINVITREPREQLEVNAKSFFGGYTAPRYKSWEWSNSMPIKKGFEISAGKRFGDFGVTLAGGLINDDSYRQFDDSKRYYVLSKFNYTISDKMKAKFLVNYALEDKADWLYWRNLDSALVPPFGTDLSLKTKSTKLNVNFDYEYIFNSKNFLNLKAGTYMTNFAGRSDLPDSNLRSSFANSINLELQYNSILTDYLFLTSGVTFNRNNVSSNINGKNNQTLYGAYAQFELKPIHDMVLTLGSRYDNEVVEGLNNQAEISPKFGISYTLINNLTLRGSFGSGFRSPRPAERYATFKAGGFDLIPNLDLRAETSKSYEVGAMYDLLLLGLPVSFDLAIFNNNFNDLIEPTFVTKNFAPVIQFINLTKARITGLEFNVKTMFTSNVGFETSITLTDPRDETLNETLKYRSKVLWYNHLFFEWQDFGVNIDYRYMSRSEKIDEKLGLQVIDHDARVDAHITDLNINYNFKHLTGYDFTLSAFAKNLFDYYYTEMTGNLAQTRFIGLEIKYDFGKASFAY